ncbi:MAG: response regulator [Acidimicrobiales bacterium]
MKRTSETTPALIVDAAPEAMLVLDTNGVLVTANHKAELLFGLSKKQMIGSAVSSLFPNSFPLHGEDVRGLLITGLRPDGTSFQAEISKSSFESDDEHFAVAIVRDVSTRSELEAKLSKSEDKRSVAEGVRLEAEHARVKAEGEKSVAEGVRLEAEDARVKAEDEKTVAEGVRLEAEDARLKAEGEKTVAERLRLEAEDARVKAEGEKTVAERVRLEAEDARVKAEGEKTVADRVRLEAEDARVKAEGEKTVAERVRLEAEDARVKAEGEKTVAERVRLEAEDARVKAEGEKTVAERLRLEAEDARVKAERVRLEAEATRVKADHEKSIAEGVRLEAEVQRIKAEAEKTEAERVRLEAEMELERLKSLLHQSQRMESLGQLAGGVAHDFNNLLAVILNYASFVGEELEKAVAAPQGDQWSGPLNDVKQIQMAAERASVLTHQLLAFARREVIQARSLSFNEALSNIEEMLRRTIGEQVELTIALEPDLANIMADPGHIEQIILNLAINARDAMPLGGTLSIVTSSRHVTESEWPLFGAPSGAYICVQFSDNGTGMSREVCERAFEPFFTTKPRGEGSGLGLATVYGIVLQSGGFTKIYSDEGVGTCVNILLPVDKNSLTGSGPRSKEEKSIALEGLETILVVDDEEGLREVTRRILSRSGYTVLTASSGAEAIEIATSYPGRIDLLLTDVIMAKMQGPTVAKEVAIIRPDVKVLFMSGHAQPVLEAEAVLGTEFQLVEKPFDQKMLLTNVRLALDTTRESLSSRA